MSREFYSALFMEAYRWREDSRKAKILAHRAYTYLAEKLFFSNAVVSRQLPDGQKIETPAATARFSRGIDQVPLVAQGISMSIASEIVGEWAQCPELLSSLLGDYPIAQFRDVLVGVAHGALQSMQQLPVVE